MFLVYNKLFNCTCGTITMKGFYYNFFIVSFLKIESNNFKNMTVSLFKRYQQSNIFY